MDELKSDNQPLESDDGQLDTNSSDQFESDNNEESRRKEDEDIDEHDRLKIHSTHLLTKIMYFFWH